MTHSHVTRDSFVDSITCVTWLFTHNDTIYREIGKCLPMIHSHVTHDSFVDWFTCVTWLLTHIDTIYRKRGKSLLMTHSYVTHDSFKRDSWLIHTWLMTHSHVTHDSFTRDPWLIHTYSRLISTWAGSYFAKTIQIWERKITRKRTRKNFCCM